jgi:hypothetical protein
VSQLNVCRVPSFAHPRNQGGILGAKKKKVNSRDI